MTMALSKNLLGLTILIVFLLISVSGDDNDLGKSDNVNTPPISQFTAKEIEAIKQLREEVSPYLYQSFMRRDQYLIRWIRDANFNLEAAKTKLLKNLKWRKDNKIDTILQEDFSSLYKTCPYSIKGHDKEGRPLATAAFGSCDLRKLALSGNLEKFERFMTFILESCADAVRQAAKSGKNVNEGTFIADLNGFNLRQHGCLRCIPALFSVLTWYESYYPDYIHRIFFINIPRVALPILDILLQALSPKTREIFKPYGFDRQEWETEIRKYIDPDQIGYQFGGNKN